MITFNRFRVFQSLFLFIFSFSIVLFFLFLICLAPFFLLFSFSFWISFFSSQICRIVFHNFLCLAYVYLFFGLLITISVFFYSFQSLLIFVSAYLFIFYNSILSIFNMSRTLFFFFFVWISFFSSQICRIVFHNFLCLAFGLPLFWSPYNYFCFQYLSVLKKVFLPFQNNFTNHVVCSFSLPLILSSQTLYFTQSF